MFLLDEKELEDGRLKEHTNAGNRANRVVLRSRVFLVFMVAVEVVKVC